MGLCGFQQGEWSTTLSDPLFDSDIHDSQTVSKVSSRILTYVFDYPLPEIKTRVVTDRGTDGWIK